MGSFKRSATVIAGGIVQSATTSTTGKGAGWVGGGDSKSPTVSNINGRIITKLYIDMTGNTSKDDVDDIIGDATGGGVAAAYVYRHVNSVNGMVQSVTMHCTETPTTGADDIDLKLSATATLKYDDDASGQMSLLTSGGAWAAGLSKAVDDGAAPAVLSMGNFNNFYLYLCSGEAVAGEYDAGKFIITIIGNETF